MPDGGLAPDQSPVALQELAAGAFHVTVLGLENGTTFGLVDMVGEGGSVAVTTLATVLEPVPSPQVRLKIFGPTLLI